jgi:hypothetical protein
MARPRPVPAEGARAGAVNPVESLEDATDMFGGDAFARIGHQNAVAPARALMVDAHCAALRD